MEQSRKSTWFSLDGSPLETDDPHGWTSDAQGTVPAEKMACRQSTMEFLVMAAYTTVNRMILFSETAAQNSVEQKAANAMGGMKIELVME